MLGPGKDILAFKNFEEKTVKNLLPGIVASAACEPEDEGLNTDSVLYPETDQGTHLPCDWNFTLNIILRQEL